MKLLLEQRYLVFVLIAGAALSLAGFVSFYEAGELTAYNDARAHLNMARFVFDNLNPGLAQIGSVWLPLPHILMLPLVWADVLWQTGSAGAVLSMLSYVLSGILMYRLGLAISGRHVSGVLAALAFLLNANALYMQSVPMTELLLLLFFIATTYLLVLWVQTRRLAMLLGAALALTAATLTRYDGWFLLGWSAGIITLILLSDVPWRRAWTASRISWRRAWATFFSPAEGMLVLFCVLASTGVLFWIGWNFIIFGDPLYFATGPYSARAQQDKIAAAGNLHTAGDWLLSLKAYILAVGENVGWPLTAAAAIGLILSLWMFRSKKELLAVTALLSPFVFHVMSLHFGNSILMLPGLGLHDVTQVGSAWFNVRYGLMMLPAAALFATYYIRQPAVVVVLIIALAGSSYMTLATDDVIVHIDGTRGSSSLRVGEEALFLRTWAGDDGAPILISSAFHNALMYSSGFDLRRFVHEGSGEYWERALQNPGEEVGWIVMANGDVGENIYRALIQEQGGAFLYDFEPVFRGGGSVIYRKSDFTVQAWRTALNGSGN